MRWVAATALLCAIACPAAHATRCELRVSQLVNLHFYVRALADSSKGVPDLPGLAEAVAHARTMAESFGSPLLWGPIEGSLSACADSAEAIAACSALADSLPAGPRGRVALRDPAVSLARALARVEPAYLAQLWPAHQAAIEVARRGLEPILAQRERNCFDYIEQSLVLTALAEPIPVFLIAEGPFPHGVTHRGPGGRGVCFVSLNGNPGSLLFETILHEATHALDVASEGSVLEELRQRLEKMDLPPGDRRLRDIPHTLLFVQAAETVRRVVDPAHRDYGEVKGYYRKTGRVAEVARWVWKSFLDGHLSREQAVQKIVSDLVPPAPAQDPDALGRPPP